MVAIENPAQNEQQIGEPVKVVDVDRYGGFRLIEGDETSFRPATYGARDVADGSRSRPAGQYELLQRGQRGVVLIQFFFQPPDMGLSHAHAPWNAQISPQIEKVVLDVFQTETHAGIHVFSEQQT